MAARSLRLYVLPKVTENDNISATCEEDLNYDLGVLQIMHAVLFGLELL